MGDSIEFIFGKPSRDDNLRAISPHLIDVIQAENFIEIMKLSIYSAVYSHKKRVRERYHKTEKKNDGRNKLLIRAVVEKFPNLAQPFAIWIDETKKLTVYRNTVCHNFLVVSPGEGLKIALYEHKEFADYYENKMIDKSTTSSLNINFEDLPCTIIDTKMINDFDSRFERLTLWAELFLRYIYCSDTAKRSALFFLLKEETIQKSLKNKKPISFT